MAHFSLWFQLGEQAMYNFTRNLISPPPKFEFDQRDHTWRRFEYTLFLILLTLEWKWMDNKACALVLANLRLSKPFTDWGFGHSSWGVLPRIFPFFAFLFTCKVSRNNFSLKFRRPRSRAARVNFTRTRNTYFHADRYFLRQPENRRYMVFERNENFRNRARAGNEMLGNFDFWFIRGTMGRWRHRKLKLALLSQYRAIRVLSVCEWSCMRALHSFSGVGAIQSAAILIGSHFAFGLSSSSC